MRLSLHCLVLTPVLLAAAVVTPQHASAAVLHVPFAFTVSGQNLPACDYSVVRDSRLGVVTLVTSNQKSFNWLLAPGEPDPGYQGVIMRFDSTDSGYALRNIQYNALITGQLDKKAHQNEDRP